MKAGTIEYTVNKSRNEMNEWKELKIDNLPSDIAIRDMYDFKWCDYTGKPKDFIFQADPVNSDQAHGIIWGILAESQKKEKLLYRKRQPKAPSHEELLDFHISNVQWCQNSQIGAAVLFLLEQAKNK